MLFRRIILTAFLIGLLGGIVLTGLQSVEVWPVISSAEQYEQPETDHPDFSAAHNDDVPEHTQDHEAWSPENGWPRILSSSLSNTLVSIGFATLLLALMALLQLTGITRLNTRRGLLWGLAGFAVFFAAPGLGLPPEIPGTLAAPLGLRQMWWIFTILMTSTGIGLLVFSPYRVKVMGLVMVVLPYLVGAPHYSGALFSVTDSHVVVILHHLQQRFWLATGVTNFVFWLLLGSCCAWTVNRWILKDIDHHAAQA
ncbi:CbtA family protein [Gynuella sunshinyii]|uniref:Putative integral membrane protein n=1 Tax=Gynuella sunshinyii YC6258 TaxID=1445510 RepID=A0A0C5VCE4_9GAMM|nr:CbtA family protein [Gynuella sunshinyii]AJQ92162.1 putative integral membrane protein [Gynuella sunshinyii YC6258]